ncbi:outer membrane beta-barrel protein [Chitinophaga sp. GCM10012297]|uniref:Outer membrane beta-barrel protein n=1 Tax=Chitinophaga chungangae TaxID=2821488 RepID=A0ABS3YBZ7_9BACT|nr:outer membrane beta-barrel protein [Chitinophaga chungangae]MBO9152194.1 outer membrane beta-barrel protein [Chitinophaga chungangae]
MQSATVSVYKVGTEELVSYQLTNNFGRFSLKQLPVGIQLRLVATNIGYLPAKKVFVISSATNEINLQSLNLERSPIALKEVTVSGGLPPVQVRGDTLEFNADAFKLDSNAVVEDMLRKVPGITVWNDGLITVNGRKINRLLVDGKEFFGQDGKIALQNLQKDAVRKIQVYEDKKEEDPNVPKTNMNIVLKKDKKDGYFGKVSAGLGTVGRYDGNGTFNYFSPKNQISLGGAVNNVNKTANNISSLISINSFKGAGVGNDYHADFRKSGETVYKAAGVSLFHDFSRLEIDRIDTNNLKVEYFMTSNSVSNREQLTTEVSLGEKEFLSQEATNNSDARLDMEMLSAKYDKKYAHSRLLATYDLQHNAVSTHYNRISRSASTLTDELTENSDVREMNNNRLNHTVDLNYSTQRHRDFGSDRYKSVNMETNYRFGLGSIDEDSKRSTMLTTTDGVQNQSFDRLYNTRAVSSFHSVANSLNDVLSLAGLRSRMAKIDLKNSLLFQNKNQTDAVSDFSGSDVRYIPNESLSTKNATTELSYRPGLNFSKSMVDNLSGRYRKTWSFNLLAESEFFSFKNESRKEYQNLNRSYFFFLPSSSIGRRDYRIGKFQKTYTLKYTTRVQYPTLEQLAPVVDNANLFSLDFGSIALQAPYTHDVSFKYSYNNSNVNYPFQGEISVVGGATKNFISDSSYYEEFGRRVYFPVNVSGERHLSGAGRVQKALKFDKHQFQLSGSSNVYYSKFPSYLDGEIYQTTRQTLFTEADLVYSFSDLLTARVGASMSSSRTARIASDVFRFGNVKTYTNVALTMPKKIFLTTRFEFNKNTSTNVKDITFAIWNLDLGYRFFKGANGEIKLSGLDLLRQNKGIVNYVNNNSISVGAVNVLQQYFMITLAYYPRKFGLKGK